MRAAVAVAAIIASATHTQVGPSWSEAAQAAAKAFIAATSDIRSVKRDRSSGRPATTPTLGVACSITSAGAQVIAVMPKSPAETAGLRPGALIISVNGVPLAGMPPEAIAAALRPPTAKVAYGLANGKAITLIRTAPTEETIPFNAEPD